MMQNLASWFLAFVGVYAVLGLVFAAAFVTRGARRIDPQADGGSRGFRLAIFPGCVALWPLLMRRWRPWHRQSDGSLPPEEKNSHRDRARGRSAR